MVCAKANVLVKIHETVKSKILHLLASYMCNRMQDTNIMEIMCITVKAHSKAYLQYMHIKIREWDQEEMTKWKGTKTSGRKPSKWNRENFYRD